ncbi:hypothetical protein DFP72DRAFT_1061215 [Ephemerocybe angulata]|uniref:Uncharacterized protein n=1 Tax=Ephemerocybe angulata TaxID=980116 RepID=A0A8H6IAG1_9AGAR|nr:hypothetical protein DFP72DRAFT_1061215 [Tulosesus angulatus]
MEPGSLSRSTSVAERLGGGGRSRNAGDSSGSVSPPPAYGELARDSEERGGRSRRGRVEETLLGSPIPTTFKLMGGGGEGEEWMHERSKEELTGLLLKAGDIIKERENELGLTSKAVKGLYENNVALKTKHEALLARIPVNADPAESPSASPDRVISRNNSYSDGFPQRRYSPSPPMSPSPSVPPPLYRGHARRASISTNDISQLADQNAELLSKLEQLESESTSADHAGRRELRRLEREIATLRQALERTQAKSEELEAKTKGLDRGIDRVVEDAWKRKKEREQKMRAMRNSTSARNHWGGAEARGEVDEMGAVRDFAPRGSGFGGPSKAFPSRSMGRVQVDVEDEDSSVENNEAEVVPPPPQPKPELELVAQLLQKVKELEQTNSRILQQQAETTNQLQAVQRDTENITKAYEYLAEPEDLEFEDPPMARGLMDLSLSEVASSTPNKFVRRRVDSMSSMRRGKLRRSIHGSALGDSTPSNSTPFAHANQNLDLPAAPFASWINENRHRSSFSMGSASGLASPLTFHDSDPLAELSPIGTRLTLESELQPFSAGLAGELDSELQHRAWHLRSQSLSNLSQFSVPSSPAPLPSVAGMVAAMSSGDNKTPVAADFPTTEGGPRTPSPRPMPGMLPLPQTIVSPPTSASTSTKPGLNILPPTPSKNRVLHHAASASHLNDGDDESATLAALGKSPRHEFISQRIRARKARWEDGRFGSMSSTAGEWGSPTKGQPRMLGDMLQGPVFVPPPGGTGRLNPLALRVDGSSPRRSRAGSPAGVQIRLRGADDVSDLDGEEDEEGAGEREGQSPEESEYEDAVSEAYDEETGDEASFRTNDERDDEDDDEQTMVNRTPQFAEDNALQLHHPGLKNRSASLSPSYSSGKFISGGSPHSTSSLPGGESRKSRGRKGTVTAANAHLSENGVAKTGGPGKWGSVLLEAWLWLQFAVIIFVFLCAMAKRGPKAVLADAEHRTRTRKESVHLRRR